MRTTTLAGIALAGLLLAACTNDDPPAERDGEVTEMAALDPTASLTSSGSELLAASDFDRDAPRVHIVASADPATGAVEGTAHARLPVGSDADEAHLRYMAGLLDASPAVGRVTVDGKAAEASRDEGLLSVRLPEGHGDDVAVEVPFSYTLPESEEPSLADGLNGSLELSDVGLLARHEGGLSLGHWFPIWMPEGVRDDAAPDGFGDISNFPAADLSMKLTVPDGWTVIDGGVRVGESTEGGDTTVTSYATGMRDLSVVVAEDIQTESRQVGDVTVLAHAPKQDADNLSSVLDETESAFEQLSESFGDYPWKEFDVVSTPLGGGVAGMEWPGATWIESAAFAGGVPGLGSLGDLVGSLAGELGEAGMLLETTRPWTIAHEVGHEWWTVLVGNDSIAAPVVDEPLAQYSACLVMRSASEDGDEVCRTQIAVGYDGMREAGEQDGSADQATDEFDSGLQYAGLVYGKAAWFYLDLEEEYGADRVREVLRDVVRENAFEMMTADDLRAGLVAGLGDEAGDRWEHWMQQAHGDQDMPEVDLGIE
jgi:hypothetical protein